MMKLIAFLSLGLAHANGQTAHYLNLLRQNQLDTGIVWDMPVDAAGSAVSALVLEGGGALFQLWTIRQDPLKDYLLDQKLVGTYLPSAEIAIATADPDGEVPRTRVDKPFTVEIQVNGLLTGTGIPQASSSVLIERHIASYSHDPGKAEMIPSLDPVEAISGRPHDSASIGSNGRHLLSYPASSLTAADPTKASGEEHFVIHALADGEVPQSQIASAMVKVWPVASGNIKGIENGDSFRFQLPQVELLLHDLYPRSDTYLILCQGTGYQGVEGSVVTAFPMDRETSASHVLRVSELESKLEDDGYYTLVLMSETVYGREMLCPPVTFHIRRTLQMNAMQAGFSDGKPR